LAHFDEAPPVQRKIEKKILRSSGIKTANTEQEVEMAESLILEVFSDYV
jgi:hypothetical protein